MKSESLGPKERDKIDDWVALADPKDLITSQRATIEDQLGETISWIPATILDARHLEISVQAVTQLSKYLHLQFPLEIQNFSTDEPEDKITPNQGDGPLGLMTLTSRMLKRVKKPNLSQVEFNDETGRIILKINFHGISTYLVKTLVEGVGHPHYFERYGELVNEAFYQSFPQIILANLRGQIEEMPQVVEQEFANMVMALVPTILALVEILSHSLAPKVVMLSVSELQLGVLAAESFVVLWILLQAIATTRGLIESQYHLRPHPEPY